MADAEGREENSTTFRSNSDRSVEIVHVHGPYATFVCGTCYLPQNVPILYQIHVGIRAILMQILRYIPLLPNLTLSYAQLYFPFSS